MNYISRRLSFVDDQGKQVECADADFFALNAPLIVLGEPGAGKSELVKQFSTVSHSQLINASTVEASSVLAIPDPPAKIIIDGIDEITAYEAGTSVCKILAKLPQDKAPNFILTCRAVDWQDTVTTAIIQQKWQQKPIVGRILPLNHQEIIDFVNAKGNGQNGEDFIKEAKRHDVIDLLKNPQNLTMLLSAVHKGGWPDTRLELYEKACLDLIEENSPMHDSINRTRPAPDKLLETAGFIFAQMLFSGKSGIRIDGSNNIDLPKIMDLAAPNIDESIIRSALSTKVFKTGAENVLEPCHRTIAEYLAAKWLTSAIRGQLSLKRVERLLYGNGYIVPASLRGLHAWMATLHPGLADKFITRDPYGFFRYGDPSVLTIPQSKNLLKCLEKVAGMDPYFRSEDWYASFGKGFAKPELKEDIIKLIRNRETPYQLKHLIVESLRGDEVANDIANDLLELIFNTSASTLERNAAVDALMECNSEPDWKEVVSLLEKNSDIESLRVAIDIIQPRIELFDGKKIAEILIGIENALSSGEGPNYASIAYNIHKKMSSDQLESSLKVLSQHSPARQNIIHRSSTEEWVFKFLQERLERGSPPTAATLWSWIGQVDEHGYHRSEWNEFSADYFSQNSDLRQAIQIEAINAATDDEALWMTLWSIGNKSHGLWLRENDLILHMDRLLSNKEKYRDWQKRWQHLVRWCKMNRDFTGEGVEHGRKQTKKYAELKEKLAELERPPSPEMDYAKKFRKQEQKFEKERQKAILKRHKSYNNIQNQLGSGQHLNALSNIANAYLGRFSDLREKNSPLDRIAELIGEKLLPLALEGLDAATKREDIPSPRTISELHANESKEYFFEPILLVQCAIIINKNEPLENLPFTTVTSALAACQWDMNFAGDKITPTLQKQLEDIVFHSQESKESFIRDTVEPYLEKGSDHISGLSRLARSGEFPDIAGNLSLEWLKRFEKVSNYTLKDLLFAAIRYAPRELLVNIIRPRIAGSEWQNEEQHGIWMGCAFLLDFDYHLDKLTAYVAEDKDRLWPIKAMAFSDRNEVENWPKLNIQQNYFLIDKFAALWKPANHPTDGWSGSNNPWDASAFINARINDLSMDLSDTAVELLKKLVGMDGIEEYQAHIKHVLALQTRRKSEESKKPVNLGEVRKVLLKGEPINHDDLQAQLMDELEELQDRIKNSPTNEVLPFWDNDKPHNENYCRDRIAAALTPYLDRYGVRIHTEGTMPDSNRCDLLNTHGMMDVPIEIKGQWHDTVWTAASEQLQNYTREYRAEGRGIYLVLWFGYLGANHPKNPHTWRGQSIPKTFEEMQILLLKKCEGISEKTKIILLDVSKV